MYLIRFHKECQPPIYYLINIRTKIVLLHTYINLFSQRQFISIYNIYDLHLMHVNISFQKAFY